ncbi:uncharacterized protein [Montipora capricornis]|uniref:uncharacterized protein n=1 Tax=Montipora capricornis TaxID=246305 RepID=UPI0035F1F9F1
METDESIDLQVHVGLNAYGSRIYEGSEEEEKIAEDEEMICNCKGACARKKGQGFCLCKAANKNCSTRCRCPHSKCKNKARENTQENEHDAIDPDGEVQLAREVQSSATQIEVCRSV